jgi:hypothetical protein
MAYRRFIIGELRSAPATLATFATVDTASPQTVASVANVADSKPKSVFRAAGSADLYTGWDEEDWRAAFEERAGILEYDGGHSRQVAERLARTEIEESWSRTR